MTKILLFTGLSLILAAARVHFPMLCFLQSGSLWADALC